MEALKKYLGIVWIALGPAALFFLIRTAVSEISKNPALNTGIQWGIFVLIFIPIAIGLVLFGYYAWKGEYQNTED
jgi:hypothetical protein